MAAVFTAAVVAAADAGITVTNTRYLDPTPRPSTQITFDGEACLSNGLVWSAAISNVEVFDIIRVTRSDFDGGVLDPFGIPVDSAIVDIWGPRIACAPQVAAVVWLDATNTVRAKLFDSTGALTKDVAVASNSAMASVPHAAWDGTNFVVSWRDSVGNVRATRITLTGTLLDVGGVRVIAGTTDFSWAPSSGALVWTQSDALLRYARVSGNVLLPGVTQVLTPSSQPSEIGISMSDAGTVLVTWTQARTSVPLRREPWGFLEDAGAPRKVGSGTGDEWLPRPFFTGAEPRVAYVDGQSAFDSHVWTDGGIRTLSTRNLGMRTLSASSNGAQTFVFTANGQALNFGWLDRGPSQTAVDEPGFARAQAHQLGHEITGDSASAAVWWRQLAIIQDQSQDIRMTRFSALSQSTSVIDVLTDCCTTMMRAARVGGVDIGIQRKLVNGGYDAEALVLPGSNVLQQYAAPTGFQGNGTEVAIATRGNTALAVFRNDQRVLAWRVTPALNDVASAVSVVATTESTSPAAVSVGTGWWVVWKEGTNIRGVQIQETPVLTAGSLQTLGTSATTAPSIASDGVQSMVLFGSGNAVKGFIIDSNGSTAAPFLLFSGGPTVTAVHHQFVPGGVLVAWANTTSDPISAALATETGSMIMTPVTLSGTGLVVHEPRVTALPSPMVAWREVEPTTLTWQIRVAELALTIPGFDAGVPDAGITDAGSFDSGIGDAGASDAGSVDAGGADAGPLDAGFADAGAADAGPIDSGIADAGDAGAIDSGLADAGDTDAGTGDAGPDLSDGGTGAPVLNVGCACTSTGAGSTAAVLLLTVLALRRRRRS